MIRTLKTLLARLAAALAVLVILFGAAMLLVRTALPYADGLRGQVTERLSQMLGVEVRVGELGVSLRGLSPRLTLSDAELLDRLSGAPLLGLRALVIDLDLSASLAARAPRIDGVTLVGAAVELRRTADGRIAIRGLDGLRGGDDRAALDFFLREGRFSLSDSTLYWTDSFAGLPALALMVERLDFINDGRRHRIRVHGRPPGDLDGGIDLLARLDGPPRRPADWSGSLYLHWRGWDVARLLQTRLPATLRLASAGMDAKLWATLDQGRFAEVLGDLRFQELALRRAGVIAPPVHIGDISTLMRWRPRQDGWRLQLADLAAFGGWRPPDRTDAVLELRRGGDAGGSRLLAGIGSLELRPLARLAGLFDTEMPEPLPDILHQQLRGRLLGVSLRVDQPGTGPPTNWHVRARVVGLSLPAVAGLPAVENLSLVVDTGPEAGRITLGSAGATVDLRPRLAFPTTFTRLSGTLDWRRLPAGSIHLQSQALVADTADLASVTRLSVCLPPSGLAPIVDLHSHFSDGDGSATRRYLPVAVMDPALVDWLDQAIVSGRLTSGDLLLRGPLDSFPFDDHSGRFLLELRVQDGILDYAPPATAETAGAGPAQRLGWPRLEEIAALLRFEDRSLTIDVDQARLLGAEVRAGSASLPDLWEPRRLHIRAEGTGPLADGLRVLAETPLSAGLGGIPRALDATGRGRLELQLDLPLKRTLELKLNGRVLFDPADDPVVSLAGTKLRLTGLDGALGFDETGLRADGISADLDGQPLQLDIATLNSAGGGRTEVSFSGRTEVGELRRRFPHPIWGLADGGLDWTLESVVANADASRADPPLDLRFSSDLRGLALDLPAPLGKTAGAEMPLVVSGRVGGGAAGSAAADPWPLELAARLGSNGARLELDRARDGTVGLDRAAVAAGGLPGGLPQQRGLRIGGELETLDVEPWMSWRREHAGLFAPPPEQTPGAPALPLLPSRLAVGRLSAGALELRDVEADFAPTRSGGWSLRFTSDGNGGRLELPPPGSDAGIQAHLDSLNIAGLGRNDAGAGDAGGDPRRLGRLALTIDHLRDGQTDLGRLRLVTEPRPTGVHLTELRLDGPLLEVSGSGEWTVDDTGYEQTRLRLDASSEDLGALLRHLDYYTELSDAPARAALELRWPGGPGAVTMANARGRVDSSIGAGRLLQVNPGVGRMLGVLNLSALRRRLSLDFSDVFDEGFGFDGIDGQLLVGSGQARIGNLEIRAAPADIRITGSADLVNETFDQTVQVTPKIGTGVALASAVAGGPLVGAAVFLADKVAGDAVDRLARYEYRVTGPWRDPTIVRVGSTLLNGAGPAAGGEAAVPPRTPPPAPADMGGERTTGRPGADASGDRNPFLEGF